VTSGAGFFFSFFIPLRQARQNILSQDIEGVFYRCTPLFFFMVRRDFPSQGRHRRADIFLGFPAFFFFLPSFSGTDADQALSQPITRAFFAFAARDATP